MTFNGTWKVDRNENYEKFMEVMGEWTQTKSSIVCELLDQMLQDYLNFNQSVIINKVHMHCIYSTGINMVKRKLASHDNLKITLEQTGDKFHVKEVSTFRTVEINFTLGVTFDYSLADGTELTVSTLTLGVFSLIYSNGSLWFHKDPLTSMETLTAQKGFL